MANRIIKDSICESSGLSECSFFADDLYKRLITYADDYGRFNADPQIMLARLYPREMDCTTKEDLVTALIELCGVGKVAFYTCNPRKTVYGCLPRWSEHQRIRDSKSKCPDPDDTDVNDWYLQRFIPLDLRVEIIERDGFKCQICGKFITSDRDAKRLAKHGNGMYHIDHIVPVCHGGRATLENLRLTCPTCNLKKGSRISIKDILAGNEHSPRIAATCGNPRLESNPIQSNPNPNPKGKRAGAFVPPTLKEIEDYCRERNSTVDPKQFYDYFTEGEWKDAKGNAVKNWKQKLLTWEKYDAKDGKKQSDAQKHVSESFAKQSETEKLDYMKRMMQHIGGGNDNT